MKKKKPLNTVIKKNLQENNRKSKIFFQNHNHLIQYCLTAKMHYINK